MTDLCDYCENGAILKLKIETFIKNENSEFFESFDVKQLIKYYTDKALAIKAQLNNPSNSELDLDSDYSKYKMIVNDLNDYETILFHKNIAQCQRIAYNDNHTNCNTLKNKVLIEIDFKQKIKIGLSPRQFSKEFYQQILLSCLGKNN
jgi:hypothetical protein